MKKNNLILNFNNDQAKASPPFMSAKHHSSQTTGSTVQRRTWSFGSCAGIEVALLLLLSAGVSASAAVVPFGVQVNVPMTTVTGTWGWTLVYQGSYQDTVPISTLFSGVNPNDYVMYAAAPVGATSFTVLAAGKASAVRTQTAQNVTTSDNGVGWYYNAYSIGFAPAGATIQQNSADVFNTSDPFRLSWHAWNNGSQNPALAPTHIFAGWRAGANIGISSGWNRFVFVSRGPTTLPATSITTTSGTLNGTANPSGLATTAWFEWGTSPTLIGAASTTAMSVGNGVSDVPISQTLTSLTPDTTYYFRAMMNNSAGTQSGSILWFVTGPDIAVEQPAGTNLVDGASIANLGGGIVGAAITPATFTVKNPGGLPLTGLAITLDGVNTGDFAVSALGSATLAAGGSTTFTVTFTPGAVGARNATLHIASNDADENPFDIALAGSGYTAGSIIGGSDLLTPPDVIQLQAWLGEAGTMTLTKVFAAAPGDGKTAANFHAAVDGIGRTFSVIELPAQGGYPRKVIGGYNPQSWSSINNYNITFTDAERTAFLFNLTTGLLQRQKLVGNPNGSLGQYQTYNNSSYGPTFGGGHDLWVDNSLHNGYTYNYSYGPNAGAYSSGIADGGQGISLTFARMEVFTIALGPVATAPTVTTPTSASITDSSAVLGGNVTSDGGTGITERGVVYSATAVNGDPVIGGAGVTKVTSAGTTGVFTVNAGSLMPGTSYSFKAYAINSVGTTYTSPVATFTTLASEIGVQQPVGTDLVDGVSSVGFGNVNVGGTANLVFTINNTGNADLTGLGITFDGPDSAQFSVTAFPAAPVSGPSGSTTFTVSFAPTSGGAKTAVLHIASNDADENPFDIALTGTGNSFPVAKCKDVTVAVGANCLAAALIDDGSFDPDGDPITISQSPAGPYGLGNTLVTLTVTDSHAASSTCSATVTVVDTTPPTITCPATITQSTDAGVCNAVVNYTVTGGDNCGTANINCNPASGSTFNKGTTTVNCTVNDGNGNTAGCSFTVTVEDHENPTIRCPANITQSTDAGVCNAVVNYTVTGGDNCGTANISCNPASGSTFNKGTTTVNCTVNDGNGNTAGCSFTVSVEDHENPTITCPANITQSTDAGVCNAVVNYTVTGGDNCGTANISCNPASGSTFNKGTTTVNCTVNDGNGNTAGCSFTVTVEDHENPTITCPANITQSTDAGVCNAVVNYTVTGGDNCGTANISCNPASGSTFGKGTTTVNCTVNDGNGNTAGCSFTVTVEDHENPTITCPANITQSTDAGVCNAVVNYTVTGGDNCGTANISCSPASGSTFNKGTTTVNCTVNDGNGNTADCSFTVTVEDHENPTITCPANITQSTDAGVCNAVVTYTVIGVDNCGTANITCNPASGSTFNKGTTTVNCTVNDGNGNTAGCSFTVTVEDREKPTISCPANITQSTDAGVCNAVVTYTVTGGDNCGTANITCDPASGSTFNKGTMPVNCTVDDGNGNSATCSFTVTVEDREKPTISCPANVTKATDPGVCNAVVTYTVTGGDNCGTANISCSPASGSTFNKGTTTVNCTVNDGNGNSASCSFTVTVEDREKPTISCPANITKATDPGVCNAVVIYTVTGGDNCGTANISCSPASGSTFNKGTTTVNCTVNDGNGNTAGCSFTVTVEDHENPTITCPTTYPASASCSYTVNRTDATANDNCAAVITWKIDGADPTSDSVVLGVGCHTIVWTARDDAGNSVTCSKSIEVLANLSMAYTGDSLVFTSGPTISTAPVALGAHLTSSGLPCVSLTALTIKFEVWTAAVTPSLVATVTAPVNVNGDAGALVSLLTGSTTAATYEIRAYLMLGNCKVGANEIASQTLTVDFGSTTRRIVGGGWINSAFSDNAKGTFGFVAGYTTRTKTALEGNSVFMLHSVIEGGTAYNWKVKDTAWNTATMSFYHNPTLGGTTVDSARATFKGVVQKIVTETGAVVGGFGNATIVLDVFDGDLYSPAKKDQYSIKVYDGNNLLWWGSTPATAPNPGLALGNNGPGGGNIKIFSK